MPKERDPPEPRGSPEVQPGSGEAAGARGGAGFRIPPPSLPPQQAAPRLSVSTVFFLL